MSKPAVTVRLDDELRVVKQIFEFCRIHDVVVVEEGKLIAMLSEIDVIRVISPYIYTHTYTTRDVATLNQRVHQIARRHPLSLKPQARVSEAISLFKDSHENCIPIVDDDDFPVGVLTRMDVLSFFNRTFSDDPQTL